MGDIAGDLTSDELAQRALTGLTALNFRYYMYVHNAGLMAGTGKGAARSRT
jgi:hypothetical protein